MVAQFKLPGQPSHPTPPEGNQRGLQLRNLDTKININAMKRKVSHPKYRPLSWGNGAALVAWMPNVSRRAEISWGFILIVIKCFRIRWETMIQLCWEPQCFWVFKSWAPQLQRVTWQTTLWLTASTLVGMVMEHNMSWLRRHLVTTLGYKFKSLGPGRAPELWIVTWRTT